MPLPNNFSPTEHLQEVKEWFRDVTEDDLNTPRSSLRIGCTHTEPDTMPMTIGRLLLFYQVVGAFPHSRGYIMPDRQIFQMEGNPQVVLAFAETTQSWKARKASHRETMRCSFRLMKEDFATASDEARIHTLEQKVRLAFPPSFTHQTGQTNYTYVDKPHGYQLRIAAYSESEAKDMMRKLIDCNLQTELTYQEPKFSRASTKNPGKDPAKKVLGKTLKRHERRPTAKLKLRQADLFIPGWGSRTLIYRNFE
jgi:hypothetical protein